MAGPPPNSIFLDVGMATSSPRSAPFLGFVDFDLLFAPHNNSLQTVGTGGLGPSVCSPHRSTVCLRRGLFLASRPGSPHLGRSPRLRFTESGVHHFETKPNMLKKLFLEHPRIFTPWLFAAHCRVPPSIINTFQKVGSI